MGDENENKPIARKVSNNGDDNNAKDIINNNAGDGQEVGLKAKMTLVNGITVIVGSIIGKFKNYLNKQEGSKSERFFWHFSKFLECVSNIHKHPMFDHEDRRRTDKRLSHEYFSKNTILSCRNYNLL